MTGPERQRAEAVGRIPSGLFILTLGNGNEATGMLASWVQQCSFEPPSVTIALKPDRPLAERLVRGTHFVINVLDQTQTDMVAHFGRGFAPGQAAFVGVDVQSAMASAPILSEAVAYMDCRILARYPAGDHDLFVAEIVSGAVQSTTPPMVHVRKSGAHY